MTADLLRGSQAIRSSAAARDSILLDSGAPFPDRQILSLKREPCVRPRRYSPPTERNLPRRRLGKLLWRSANHRRIRNRNPWRSPDYKRFSTPSALVTLSAQTTQPCGLVHPRRQGSGGTSGQNVRRCDLLGSSATQFENGGRFHRLIPGATFREQKTKQRLQAGSVRRIPKVLLIALLLH